MDILENYECEGQMSIFDVWVDCEERLPKQIPKGNGSYSEKVTVELSDGRIAEDWLINGRWVVHCKKNGGAYPIRWKI